MSYVDATWEDVNEGDYIQDKNGKWWRVYVFEANGAHPEVWLEDKDGVEVKIEIPLALTPVKMFRRKP